MPTFEESCDRADQYPTNLIEHETFVEYDLEDYKNRLNDRAEELFSPDESASLVFGNYDDDEQKFKEPTVKGIDQLINLMRGGSYFDRRDSRCRYIFVLADHSRAPLDTSRKMLMYALTYHQVMPAFLDFIFPYGKQMYTRDFSFSGFRHETRLADSDAGPNLPKLNRSGREIRCCYSLKSVEESDEPEEKRAPWSVRQTATYHSFDVENATALWISVKGNDLIQDRIMKAGENLKPNQRPFATKQSAFEESLSTHLINCRWSGENWRWYLNHLEEEFQRTNGHRVLNASVIQERKPEDKKRLEIMRIRSMPTKITANQLTNALTSSQPPAQNQAGAHRARPISIDPKAKREIRSEFSFEDLRDVQSLEDKANEVIYILDANINVLRDLNYYYHDLVTSKEHRKEFGSYKRSVERFEKQVASVMNNLRMQITRASALVRTLTDRKALLYGIVEYHNAKASLALAGQAQDSADDMAKMTKNMEQLTKEMNELAQKTTREAVSMRIITGVTLFFLPGTFISTIMSTDIIKFESNDGGPGPKVFRRDALNLYLYISLPLMALTFATWAVIYQLEKRSVGKEKQRAQALQIGDEKC